MTTILVTGGACPSAPVRCGPCSRRSATSAFEAVAAADAALILTEWGEFAQLDWQARAAGLQVWSVGAGA